MTYRPLSSIMIDSGTGRVYRDGLVAYLTRAEFALFRELWCARGIVADERLNAELYGLRPYCDVPASNPVKVLISRIRKAVRPLGVLIRSSWGIGYFLALADQSERMMAA